MHVRTTASTGVRVAAIASVSPTCRCKPRIGTPRPVSRPALPQETQKTCHSLQYLGILLIHESRAWLWNFIRTSMYVLASASAYAGGAGPLTNQRGQSPHVLEGRCRQGSMSRLPPATFGVDPLTLHPHLHHFIITSPSVHPRTPKDITMCLQHGRSRDAFSPKTQTSNQSLVSEHRSLTGSSRMSIAWLD